MESKTWFKLLRKELIDELRSIRTLVVIFGLNLIMVVSCIMMFYNAINTSSGGYTSNYKAVLEMYNNLLFMVFIATLISTPIIAGSSYSRELENGTLELLMLTRVGIYDLLNVKLYRVLFLNMFLVITSLPMLCLVFSVGGVGILDIGLYIVLIFVIAFCFGSIGIYLSVRFRESTKAIIYTYFIEVISTVGVLLILKIIYAIADRVYNNSFYSGANGAIYNNLQFKNMGTFLIANPMFDIFKLQSEIIGSTSFYDVTMNDFGINAVIDNLWIGIGIIIYIVIAILMLNKARSILNKRHAK